MTPMRKLAYEGKCRACAREVFVAYCIDGRWRSFEKIDYPRADVGVWAWRRRHGMQEQALVPGKLLHRCPAYYEAVNDLAPGLDLDDVPTPGPFSTNEGTAD